ncbi:MAG: cation-translocating P-type ATPase [Planctomycetota bacterium]|nr:cation-translocating P-type ATPase [Planctomycetota bacterium]
MSEWLDPTQLIGLTEAQAAQRLREDGYNELPSSRRRNVLAIVFEVVREPMFLLLIACGVVYLLLGEPKEALMLLGFVFVIMGITIAQERRTERALEALRDLSSPRALVIRDGQRKRIPGREVARGDLVILAEGDRVPADAVLRHCINVSADESLLTGESVPVRKVAAEGTLAPARPGGDDLPFVYSGTLITCGQAIAEVAATGLRSEIGKIGKALQSLETEETLLQKETGRLVRNLAIVGLSLCAVVVVVYGLTRGNTALVWKQGFLAGIAMAMAVLPEEFPVVLTIFLALGAWRISRSRVLTRRIPAIETLGAATVLCVDKTGTLTQNLMSIARLHANGQTFDATDPSARVLPEDFHQLLEFGVLASKKDPFDPMEKALNEVGNRFLAQTEHLHENWTLVREYPLSAGLLALSHVWKSPDGAEIMIAAKGAPEAIADLCHFSTERLTELSQTVAAMAGEGLRVLGVARGKPRPGMTMPAEQHDFDFEFLGLVALADPIRPAVPKAIEECYTAGVRVVMITGDYPATARSIGRQVGLRQAEEMITGAELDQMSDEQLRSRIGTINIIARAVPEQKLRIVQALKANGEIVAMTGDGVNDAPALKAAHIGIAMGGRGTDVAREAASLVLLDDDFSSIVQAVRLGRRIFDNIKKAVSYIFAIHVPIAGLSLIPVFFSDWPLILLPVHILFLELIIDPSCTMIFEAEEAEPNVMRRPPRDPNERLFGLHSVWMSLLQGFSVLVIVLGVFVIARQLGHGENNARGLTFASLVVANLGLILTNRSWSRTILSMMKVPNTALWWVVGGAGVFLGLVLSVPFLHGLFRFAPLHAVDLVICLAAGALSIGWVEFLKVFRAAKTTGSQSEPAPGR